MDIRSGIGFAADAMTLFGVGGFFTWSFIQRPIKEQDLPEIGISIFAYAIKTFLAVTTLVLLAVPAYLLHVFVVLMLAGTYGADDGLWNPTEPLAYSAAYAVTALIFIPLPVLAISSIYTWSVSPFQRLWVRLAGRR